MPKVRQPYRVRRPFSIYKKGQIIFPEGMRRSELLAYNWIELAKDLIDSPKPAPVAEPEPEPESEPEPVIEAAVAPEPETAAMPEPAPVPSRRRGRPRKVNRDA